MSIMKKIGLALSALVAFVMLFSLAQEWRITRVRSLASKIKRGDTKEQVTRRLGHPVMTGGPFNLFSSQETWAYGQDFRLGRILHGESPLSFRLSNPKPDDVVIVFDSSGRVARVSIPQ